MTQPIPAKECRDCKLIKPHTEFYFRRRSGKLGTYCKECHRKRGYKNRGYTPKLPRVDRPKVEGDTRVCTKCKDPQPLSEFYFLKNENRLAWYCKGCYKLATILNTERKKYICHRCKQQVMPEE